MSGPQEAADALRAMTDSINAAAEDHGVDGDRRDAWANGYAAGLAARAAAPPVEPRSDPEDGPNPWEPAVPPPDPVAGLREARTALTDEEAETVVKALAIGRVSYDGDPWFAKDAGYDYDDAEETLSAAHVIATRLRAALHHKDGAS